MSHIPFPLRYYINKWENPCLFCARTNLICYGPFTSVSLLSSSSPCGCAFEPWTHRARQAEPWDLGSPGGRPSHQTARAAPCEIQAICWVCDCRREPWKGTLLLVLWSHSQTREETASSLAQWRYFKDFFILLFCHLAFCFVFLSLFGLLVHVCVVLWKTFIIFHGKPYPTLSDWKLNFLENQKSMFIFFYFMKEKQSHQKRDFKCCGKSISIFHCFFYEKVTIQMFP